MNFIENFFKDGSKDKGSKEGSFVPSDFDYANDYYLN